MSENSFQKDNLGWQLQQLQQKISEWWEFHTSQIVPNISEKDLPSWWDNPIILTKT